MKDGEFMRIQVNVSDELVEQIDNYAKMMGVSRSALCSIWIGQGVMGYNKSFQIFSDIGNKITDNLIGNDVDFSKIQYLLNDDKISNKE